MSSTINITVQFGSFPEGAQMSPQEFINFLSESAVFQATGSVLTGQIGGTKPESDVGIWIHDRIIETFVDGEYKPIITVPVGAVLDWPSALAVLPTDYLSCDGQLVSIEEYKDLYAVIGRTYSNNGTNPDDATLFRLPDYRGRAGVGSGVGDYNPTERDVSDGGQVGRMNEHLIGEYFGHEWPVYKIPTQPSAPTPRYSAKLEGDPNKKFVSTATTYNPTVPPCLTVRKIIKFR